MRTPALTAVAMSLLLAACGTGAPTAALMFEKVGSACGDELVAVRVELPQRDREDAAIELLLLGPDATQTHAQGFIFSPEAIQAVYGENEALKPLHDYFNSVTVQNGVATVDFEKGALAYLNAAACVQGSVKLPIEATLKGMGVTEVRYSIDGVEFDEWDA